MPAVEGAQGVAVVAEEEAVEEEADKHIFIF